jgi:hypothetical protein
MHFRRGVTGAACERLGTRCHRLGDERSALFVQSSLMLNRLQGDLSAALAAATTRRLRSAAILSVVAIGLVIIAPNNRYY